MKKLDCRLLYILIGIVLGILLTIVIYYDQLYSTVENYLFQRRAFEIEKLEFYESPAYNAIRKCDSNESTEFFTKCVAWELKKK